MNQDVELNDQKVKVTPQEEKVDFDFITAINDRQLGFTKKNVFSSSQINAAAEDELVKKQFKEMHCELPGVPRSTFLMEFSPDGTKVASTHGNHQIYVTDVRTGKHIKTLIGHPRTPWCIEFHPTSNQIIASGCLGGQVRIWDLSGGSEVWTVESQSVIASIAFHPDDRLLVIATFNELYFWDWSKPEPFMHVSTASAKEKVRYVAFDKLGHKLITGITNSPQTRWERVRTLPVPVSLPVSTERPTTGVRRRRIAAPRFNSSFRTTFPLPAPNPTPTVSTGSNTSREPLSSVPERERRITSCYRELVNQYEVLVHRYLQIYRRPIMIDQGTDPMEIESNAASTSTQSTGQSTNRPGSPVPSTSGTQRRKSSALHPPKNRNRRMLYHSDSAGSSSSSSPVPDVGAPKAKTSSGSTQTTAPARSSTPQLGATTNNQSILQSSSSSDEEDDTNANANRVPWGSGVKSIIDVPERPSTDGNVKKFTKARQLNLTRTPPESSTSNAAAAAAAAAAVAVAVAAASDVEEPKYKMRIKCFLKPPKKDEEPPPRSEASTSTAATPPPAAGSSEADADTLTANQINHLINNAKLILSKYRVTLQQRWLQGAADLPAIPPIPAIISGLPQTGPTNKPSKGTNTNEMDSPPKRKRRLLRPNLLGNILFTSSDDSSSDNEPQSKMPCPASKVDKNEPSAVDGASTSRDQCATANSPSNEHSYADVLSQSSSSSTIKSIPPKRKRRLLNNNELHCDINADLADAGTPTNPIVPSTSIESPTGTQSENLLEVQRLVVESLSVLQQPTAAETAATSGTAPGPSNDDDRRLCGACGNLLEDASPDGPTTTDGCARTATVCQRLNSSRTSTSAVPPRTPPWRRFLSHRLSAFHPTRMGYPRSRFTPVFTPSLQYCMLRDCNNSSNDNQPTTSNFAQDEVINYAERDGEESSTTRNYHPFDPPPEVMSINPENIGIGSMYSNIVQELESSLNDVRNIRFRLGEMSDMLSNFSDRLENIMTQSNTILRNLSSSLEDLPANEGESTSQNPPNQRPSQESPDTTSFSLEDIMSPTPSWIRAYRNPYASNPVNSDHTYPLNPEATQNATLSPLHLSLQLTVTHIQRQARLLRQQVESIERIDRAMIEVAQLQMIRQMFDELHIHFGANAGSDNRNGVSSVRQMMAGTRISDSSPYDSPSDEGSTPNAPTPSANPTNVESQAAEPSTSASTSTSSNSTEPNTNTQNTQTSSNRARTRKNYPRCLFLMHRQYRRTGNSTVNARRNAAKDRVLLRRNIYRRFLPSRTNNRTTIDMSSLSMTRRLEHHLMEHSRYIGRSVIPVPPGTSTRTDVGEHVMALRLNNCRQRMNRLMGNYQLETTNANVTSVTVDGTLRFAARQALGTTLDTITRFIEVNPTMNITSTFRSQIWEVIELSLLLSELLLLQIVDSIPPPSGMNLDPERENLSMRIDQMCTRMIQSRLMGQSNQLTRSLRLLRLTVRHATQVLGQTYTARRNAMLPTNNGSERADTRQGLLDDIQNGLRNIMRMRNVREQLNGRSDDDSNFLGWYRTINDVISRYTSTGNNGNTDGGPTPSTSTQQQRTESTSSSVLNNETGEEIRPPAVTVEDANSSDENSNNDSTPPLMRPTRIGMYNFSRSQDDDSDELLQYRGFNYLNVPTVQVNDQPVPDSHHSPWHPRSSEMLFRANRQRLNERLDELRTVGLFRPRFLHPLYSGVVNPFEDNLDETHRETIYDSDVIPTVTPNHRIQVWEFSQRIIPNINNAQKNLVVNECKIHNDASVDYASDGSILVTLLPSGGYMNVTNRLGVYSLEWETLGQCLYVTSFEQNAVSVSLSPTNRHLVVGLASRRVSILPTETWTMARIFLLDYRKTTHGNLSPIRELEQNRDTNYMSVNCIRWLPTSGQGLIFATNTGHLRLLT